MTSEARRVDPALLVSAGVIVLALVLPVICIRAAIEDDKEWRAGCAEQGGVVLEDSAIKNTGSYDSRGRPVIGTTTVTTQLCVVGGSVVAVRTP